MAEKSEEQKAAEEARRAAEEEAKAAKPQERIHGKHRVNTPVNHSGRRFEPGDDITHEDVDGEEFLQALIDAGAVSHEDDFSWPEDHWSDHEPNAYDPRPAPDHGPTGRVGFRMDTKVPEPTNVPSVGDSVFDRADRSRSVRQPDHNSTVTRGTRQ